MSAVERKRAHTELMRIHPHREGYLTCVDENLSDSGSLFCFQAGVRGDQVEQSPSALREATPGSSKTKTPQGVPLSLQSLHSRHTLVVICVQRTREPAERGLSGPNPKVLWRHCSLCGNDKCLVGE